MGVVYAARDERLERDVALKTMSALAPRRDGAAALLARGARRGQRQPSQRLPDLRDRRGRRASCSSPWSCSRARRWPSGCERGAARRRRGGADRPRHAGGAGRAARARHRPPRPQAVERVPDARTASSCSTSAWRGPSWPAPTACAAGLTRDRRRHGHAALHVARAGRRRAGRRAQRSVRRRRDPVRDARRPPGVRRPHDRRGSARDPLRAAAGADRIAGGGGRRSRDPPRAGQAAGRAAGLGRRDGRRAARDPRLESGDAAGAGARADAARRAAVPRPARRSRDRLPRLQPARRDRHVAVRHQLAGRAIERDRGALRHRDARPQGARRRGRRRSRGDGHAAARRRSAARDRAARRGARRHAAHVAHRAGVARRSVRPAGRHRAARRRRAVAAAGRRAGAVAGPARRSRAPTSSICAPTSWRAPTTASPRRAISTSSASSSIRASRRRGRGSAAATASSASTSTPDPGSDARAEDALRRALALNPRLSMAHKFYANLEADIGQASRGVRRLLGEASRHGNDPELFAGLVHACRYCGLYEQSLAAHAEARRLDPNVTDQRRADAADDGRRRSRCWR